MANVKQDNPQFGGGQSSRTGGPQCAQCEGMLADVLDGTLTAEEQKQFDLHVATCEACSTMLADARRGAAWLEMLRTPRPEPPAALLERILAQTAGLSTGGQNSSAQPFGMAAAMPTTGDAGAAGDDARKPALATVLPFRTRMVAAVRRNSVGHVVFQPRLAMTAAMAFFSVGLTLNLTGVRLNEVRLANLKPANLRRSFYQADAHLVRYYTNLRVVYELESRVRDLQRGSEDDAPVDSEKKPDDAKDKKAHPAPGTGTSRRQGDLPRSLTAFYRAGDAASPHATRNTAKFACNQNPMRAQEGDLA